MIKIAKVREVKTPQRGTPQSAGIDFFIPSGMFNYEIEPGERVNIPSGIKLEMPAGHALIAMNKSGVSTRTGLIVGACVVDEDYQGEVHLNVINTSNDVVVIKPGEKLVQMLLIKINYADIKEVKTKDIHKKITERGEGGFGSTGK